MIKLVSPDKTRCVKCGICSEICPMQVIGISEEGYPEAKSYAFRLCINCAYCVDVCVMEALHHRVRKHFASSNAAAMKRYEVIMKRKREKAEAEAKASEAK